MHIAFAASECAPWATTGGLGEVVGALPREIVRLGHQVSLYLPYYRQVRERVSAKGDKKYAVRSITIPFQYYNRFAAIVDGGVHDGVQTWLVDCPELFDREWIYGPPGSEYQDNWERFALLCRAVLEASKQLGVPQVFHGHDWQAALLPVYLRTLYYFDPLLRKCGSVLTLHNAAYQGVFPAATLERLLFPRDLFTPERLEYYGRFSFLKGGIVYADALTTVSRRYAEEIQTPEFGFGLEGVLRRRASDLRGILNGVNYERWDPATDGNIAGHYTADNLAGKTQCRRDLLHAFGAGPVDDSTAVMGMVTRLATHKGMDLMEKMAESLLQENLVLIVMGSGENYYENFFRELASRSGGRVLVKIGYDEALAHKVEAGADMFLMPSRYEPSGLNQFYSMRYGTPPIVRSTGGLEDTVEEWDPATGTGTGFKFHQDNPEDCLAAIERALAAFRDKGTWTTLMRNGMKQDYSWPSAAAEYLQVYEEVARRRS